jgi:hypothetical protein
LITIGFEKQKPIIQSFLLIHLVLFKRTHQAVEQQAGEIPSQYLASEEEMKRELS